MTPKPLPLGPAELAQLRALSQRRSTSQALALRLRIVLACARGLPDSEVARREGVTRQTVAKWRSRFLEGRLEGLKDAPRSGAPRTLDEATVRTVIAKTLHALPADGTHWTTRSLARECGLSQSAVSRIWREHGLQPKRMKGGDAVPPDDVELLTQVNRRRR